MKKDFVVKSFDSADEFLIDSLFYGKPIETSLVGSFDSEGRGSRRDIELPLHRDGDYTTQYKNKIDFVALYCVRSGEAKTIIEDSFGEIKKISLSKGDAIIINNKKCRHGREGSVGGRILLRVWIESSLN